MPAPRVSPPGPSPTPPNARPGPGKSSCPRCARGSHRAASPSNDWRSDQPCAAVPSRQLQQLAELVERNREAHMLPIGMHRPSNYEPDEFPVTEYGPPGIAPDNAKPEDQSIG